MSELPSLDVLTALSLGRPLAVTVSVHSTTVPAGGLLTFMASGFAPGAMLHAALDYGRAPIGTFRLDSAGRTAETSRLQIPVTARPGAHVVTFGDGRADFDLLIHTTPSTASVTVEPAAVAAGGRLRFAGRGFPPGGLLHVKVDATGDPVGFTIDAAGAIAGTVAIPPDTPPGAHEVRFLAAGPPTSMAVPITVARSA